MEAGEKLSNLEVEFRTLQETHAEYKEMLKACDCELAERTEELDEAEARIEELEKRVRGEAAQEQEGPSAEEENRLDTLMS